MVARNNLNDNLKRFMDAQAWIVPEIIVKRSTAPLAIPLDQLDPLPIEAPLAADPPIIDLSDSESDLEVPEASIIRPGAASDPPTGSGVMIQSPAAESSPRTAKKFATEPIVVNLDGDSDDDLVIPTTLLGQTQQRALDLPVPLVEPPTEPPVELSADAPVRRFDSVDSSFIRHGHTSTPRATPFERFLPEEHLSDDYGPIDLTTDHDKPLEFSRLSSLQSELVGLLDSKVAALTAKLAEMGISLETRELDGRIDRVRNEMKQIATEDVIDIDVNDIASSPHYETQVSQAESTYPWSREMMDILVEKFGLMKFRPNQKDIINCTLSGKDSIVLMPTGGGKSLCFQLPALVTQGATRGTTVVISPLISLMQDQVYHLKNRRIEARMINSSLELADREQAFDDLRRGRLKLVYLSPEMLSMSGKMKSELKNLYDAQQLARIVIDEAHCVSSWGHDFREDYLKLNTLKDDFRGVPIMALTGTANAAVLADIAKTVRPGKRLFTQSFNRPNLYYEVRPKRGDVMGEIKTIYQENYGRTGIVFCHSQNACEDTAVKLRQLGVSAARYHAGLDKQERQELQERWQDGKVKVMCATIAFGMGVDKPDVRFVVHLTMPRSMEGFYQESGRAGRDGLPSKCYLFYTHGDYCKLSRFIDQDRLPREQHDRKKQDLDRVKQYCENSSDCRRKQILQHFDEVVRPELCKNNCDTCQNKLKYATVRKDMTRESRLVRALFDGVSMRMTSTLLNDTLRGMKNKRVTENGLDQVSQHGSLAEHDKTTVERLINHLVAEKILQEYSWSASRQASAHTYIRAGPRAVTRVILEFLDTPEPPKRTASAAVEQRGTAVPAYKRARTGSMGPPRSRGRGRGRRRGG